MRGVTSAAADADENRVLVQTTLCPAAHQNCTFLFLYFRHILLGQRVAVCVLGRYEIEWDDKHFEGVRVLLRRCVCACVYVCMYVCVLAVW